MPIFSYSYHTPNTAASVEHALIGSYGPGAAPCRFSLSDVIDIATTAATSAATGVFSPETYGAAATYDANVSDTAYVQAAIDAASDAGGGVVQLRRAYLLTKGGTVANLGNETNVDYGLWVNASGVVIDGAGGGALVMTAAPTLTNVKFVAVLFGNGGGVTGQGPDAGTFREYIGIRDVRLDFTAISQADSFGGNAVAFSHVRYFFATGNTFLGGRVLKDDAVLHGNQNQRYGYIANNVIDGAYESGIWLDGGRDCRIIGNLIKDSRSSGIQIVANLDNEGLTARCIVANNEIYNYAAAVGDGLGENAADTGGPGIGIGGGNEHIIANNLCITSASVYGMIFAANASVAYKQDCTQNQIVGNRFIRYSPGGSMFGIDLRGSDANAYDGAALECADNLIEGNTFYGWNVGARLGQQVARNAFAGNHFETSNIFLENAASALANLVGVNTYGTTAQGKASALTQTTPVVHAKAHVKLQGGSTNYDLRWADTQIIRSGTGDPNGTHSAAVGSLFLRTDGGANTTLYVKESGSGNTGWVAK